MISGDGIYWLGWLAFFVVLALMVYVMWWALFADRPRGRQRCPKCWYNLTYSPTLTCPECGYVARSERQLYQTRRRYGYAALALFVCLLVIGVVYDRMYQHGLMHFVPTKVVILLLPLADSQQSDLVTELHRRIRVESLSDYEWSMLVRRWTRGDWRARPPSEDWAQRYGDEILHFRRLLRDSREEKGSDQEGEHLRTLSKTERMLFDVPLRIEMQTRQQWPEDVPAEVMVSVTDWWPLDTLLRLNVQPEFDGAQSMTFVRGRNANHFNHVSMPLDVLPPGQSTLTFTVHVERLVDGVDCNWQPVESQQVSVDIKVRGTIEEMLAARNDERIAERMRQVFQGDLARWREGRSPLRFQYRPGHSYNALMDDLAIGVDMRLMRDDELARHLRIWWKAGVTIDGAYRPRSAHGRNRGYEIVFEDEDLLHQVDPSDERWVMHVRGDPAIALRAGDIKEYWSGEFTTDITVRFAGERADEPHWWVVPSDQERNE